jgi:dienelactone hydrolase
VLTAPAHGALADPPLQPAEPLRTALTPRVAHELWTGRLARIAGTAHYDGGEWIYEDYPVTAYGAASPPVAAAFEALGTVTGAIPQAARVPGGVSMAQATAGGGPFAGEADVVELRVAVRGHTLHVLARTTAMGDEPQTALVLLFDTGPGTEHDVPFGTGLTTAAGDVAVLVTAAGARIVDLATGEETAAPAAAVPAGDANTLQTRLPLAQVAASGELRLVATAGLGEAPPMKVVPRFDEPVQAVHERTQALALAAGDVDSFFTTISLERLRRGDRERLAPGPGYSVRTFRAPASRSTAEGADGTLREYGLYVPRDPAPGPMPATLVLRGSGMTAHSLATVTPGLFQQLGDGNGAVLVSPGGRSGFDMYANAAYRDAEQALADARRTFAIDGDRITVAGYSMGGYATYLHAATRPGRYAGALVVEGLVGGLMPATKSPIVNAAPDVVPMLANAFPEPIAIFHTTHDANVPVVNALAASTRLRDLGYRYRLQVFPGDHFSPGIVNDYRWGADYLAGLRREPRPAEVRFTRSLPFERAVDLGEQTDAPLAGTSVGLRFADAFWVHDLEPADRENGTATIRARSLALPQETTTPRRTLAPDPGDGAQLPSVRDEQTWEREPAAGSPRNAFALDLTGVASVTLDAERMGLRREGLEADVTTDTPVAVTLRFADGPLTLRFG